jgi:hypothetical protein
MKRRRSPEHRIAQIAYMTEYNKKRRGEHLSGHAVVPRDFDEAPDEHEIETIAVSIGATGARRPASE